MGETLNPYFFETGYRISNLIELGMYSLLAARAEQEKASGPPAIDMFKAPAGFTAKPVLPDDAIKLIGTCLTSGQGPVLVLEGLREGSDERACGVAFPRSDNAGNRLVHIYCAASQASVPKSSIGLSPTNAVVVTIAGENLKADGVVVGAAAFAELNSWRAATP